MLESYRTASFQSHTTLKERRSSVRMRGCHCYLSLNLQLLESISYTCISHTCSSQHHVTLAIRPVSSRTLQVARILPEIWKPKLASWSEPGSSLQCHDDNVPTWTCYHPKSSRRWQSCWYRQILICFPVNAPGPAPRVSVWNWGHFQSRFRFFLCVRTVLIHTSNNCLWWGITVDTICQTNWRGQMTTSSNSHMGMQVVTISVCYMLFESFPPLMQTWTDCDLKLGEKPFESFKQAVSIQISNGTIILSPDYWVNFVLRKRIKEYLDSYCKNMALHCEIM